MAGERFRAGRGGGRLGLDHTHFSDAGYAVMANVIIEEIAAVTGVRLPLVDLAPIAAADPRSPSALEAAGLSCPAD